MFHWLPELLSTDFNRPMLCRGFSISAGQRIVETTLGEKSTYPHVKGSSSLGEFINRTARRSVYRSRSRLAYLTIEWLVWLLSRTASSTYVAGTPLVLGVGVNRST
jgi:hypothetical protein